MKRVSWWDSDRSRANEWLSIYIYIYLRLNHCENYPNPSGEATDVARWNVFLQSFDTQLLQAPVGLAEHLKRPGHETTYTLAIVRSLMGVSSSPSLYWVSRFLMCTDFLWKFERHIENLLPLHQEVGEMLQVTCTTTEISYECVSLTWIRMFGRSNLHENI